jgi:hypothetical protein
VADADGAIDAAFVASAPPSTPSTTRAPPPHATVRDAILNTADVAFELAPMTKSEASAFGVSTRGVDGLARYACLRQRLKNYVSVRPQAYDLMGEGRVIDGYDFRGRACLPLPLAPASSRRRGACFTSYPGARLRLTRGE